VIVAVYCIAKNEEMFIRRWTESAREADYLLVADTGSTDGTAKAASDAGAKVVHVTVDPWRFDVARNASLDALPEDIDFCVALDADEILLPGWRKALETVPGTVTRPRYRYVWSWNVDGSPGKTYGGDKIHARVGYRWKHPVHETLRPSAQECQHWVDELEIHHHPDNSKSRSQYLPLLELSVREDPHDDRNAHYYARELYFVGRLDEAACEFIRHLSLPSARWMPERSASMRYLAKCRPKDARAWLLRAIAEAPDRREPLVELAQYEHDLGRWPACYAFALAALALTDRPNDYISDAAAWGWLPHDLAAISAYWMGLRSEAARHGSEATRLNPSDERLRKNLDWYRI
jgi:glycosyltransferase involved in cell wall biosynthesis